MVGTFEEELGRFQCSLDAAIAAWMPITQSLDGVSRFAEDTILGEKDRVEGLRSASVGRPLTSSWTPSTPVPHHINTFALPMQIATRGGSTEVLEQVRCLYREAQVNDTLRMLVYDGARCLGWLGLLRASDGKNFDDAALREAQAKETHWSLKICARHRQDNELLRTSPAHIVVDEKGRIVAASRGAEAWLDRRQRKRVSDAAAYVRSNGSARLVIGRYVFDGVIIANGSSTLVYLNAPLGTFGSVALGVLSRRQRQVADLVSLGMSNHECAEELSLSVHTVKQHLAAAYRLLGVSRREELVVMLGTRKAEARTALVA